MIRTVPSGSSTGSAGAAGATRARRGTYSAAPRTASSASPVARTAPSTSPGSSVSVSSRMIWSGFSACAARISPQTAAPPGSVTVSSPPAGTAPRVSTTSRVSSRPPPASQVWTTSRVRSVTASGVSSGPVAAASRTTARGSTAPSGVSSARVATSSAVDTWSQGGVVAASSGRGQRDPVDAEEHVAAARGAQLLGGDRAEDQRVRAEDGAAGLVGGFEGQRVRGRAGATRIRRAAAP